MKEMQGMAAAARDYEGMRNANAPVERRASVLHMIEELEQAISEMSCAVDQTEAQLQPILLPEPPQADKESGLTTARSVSQMMEMLDNQIQRIMYQTRRIQKLNRRLTI